MNLCFPIAVLFLTLLLMHIVCLTFLFLARFLFILFSLCATDSLQEAILHPLKRYIHRCKMMSDHLLLPSSHSLSLSARSFNPSALTPSCFWPLCAFYLTFAALTTPRLNKQCNTELLHDGHSIDVTDSVIIYYFWHLWYPTEPF